MNFSGPVVGIEMKMEGVGHVIQADEKEPPVEDSTNPSSNAHEQTPDTPEK